MHEFGPSGLDPFPVLVVGGEIVDAVLLGLTREHYLGYVQNRMRTMIRLMERKR